MRSKKCAECGAVISASDTVCPFCGAIQATGTSKNAFVPEAEMQERRKSYLDGRTYLLQGEEVVGTFMPDMGFKRRAFRSAFLASFIYLLIVTGFGIFTGISGLGPLSALSVILFVLTTVGVPLLISLPISFVQIRKLFSVVYVITSKRIIIPQVRKKNGPVIMRIADVPAALLVKNRRIKSESEEQQYSLTFLPPGSAIPANQTNPQVTLRDLFTSMRRMGRQSSLRLLITNSFRLISFEEAQKGLSMFNSLKQPVADKASS
ncbi:MAG: zinc ribbon domain-containing protein [Thermoplasmata archaeon]